MFQKIGILFLIGSGEALMIAAQIYGARQSAAGLLDSVVSLTKWPLYATLVGALLVLSGYLAGIRVFQQIWLVTLTSWTAVVLAEAIIAYSLFGTLPEGRVLVGILLVLVGFGVSTF
jgi:hypothetical protein